MLVRLDVGPRPALSQAQIREELDQQIREKEMMTAYENSLNKHWADKDAASAKYYQAAQQVCVCLCVRLWSSDCLGTAVASSQEESIASTDDYEHDHG